jgi:hypothetical protein
MFYALGKTQQTQEKPAPKKGTEACSSQVIPSAQPAPTEYVSKDVSIIFSFYL